MNIQEGNMEDKNELDYTCGISDDELTTRFKEAVRIEKEIKKNKKSSHFWV